MKKWSYAHSTPLHHALPLDVNKSPFEDYIKEAAYMDYVWFLIA